MHPSANPSSRADVQHLTQQFQAYVQSPDFPCVGARSAVNRGAARFQRYAGLGRGGEVQRLCTDLEKFSAEFPQPGEEPTTFVAMFDDVIANEAQFEHLMWQHLQDVHEHDRQRFAWDKTVSADPASEDFSFSVAGRAFFVVGLSPVASRIARRAPMPCLVFNFHDQFENFRASGKYAGLQKVIRRRDVALQGDINPVLANHGEASEARQYSGRPTTPGWRCPFAPGGAHAGR